MSTSNQPQPERQPAVAAAKAPGSTATGETKRPTDSVPIATGNFAKLPLRFGRYQVEKLLGKGAMGAVYLARDSQLQRLVALKIPILSAKGSEKLLKRLKTEAMAAAQIDHPCVCPVFDSGDIEGIPYIAMQYIEGETLKDHLKNQAKTPQQAVRLIVQLAEGLAEAHSRKIYHRDLKPENIKLNRRGVPVIMDFGLAKLAATLTADAGATQKGSILGSPAYMSPEQAGGLVEEIDHRSDLYALGVMLYEMLTGTWPFTGSAMQVMGQKSVLEPPSVLTAKPDLNPQLAAVCHKLLARKREDRYQTAQEVIAALELIDFAGRPPAAGTQPPFGSSTDAVVTDFLNEIAVGSPKPAPPEKAPAPRFAKGKSAKNKSGKNKKKPLLIGGGILGVLALLAGLVISFRTKEGTLVVTVNEPDAEVEVLNEAGEVEIKRKGDTEPITISVDPGKHRLKVQKDGFQFFSKDFEMASRGTRSIRAKLLPLDDEPPVTAQTKPVTTLNGKPAAAFSKEFETSDTFLADLSPVWKSHLQGCFSTDGTILGRKYQVQGKESPHGIFLHPPAEGFSEVVYTLHRAFEKFESGVAIRGTGPGAGSPLTFEVIADDKVLWTSKPVQQSNLPQSCAVNVKNVNALTLRVHCPGNNASAHAVWFEPRVSASASTPAIASLAPKWDVERSTAEWVLSRGGTVGIRIERQEQEIGEGGTLPAGNFFLEQIDLRNTSVTGTNLTRLEGLTNLHRLYLGNYRIGDAGLEHLRNLTSLSDLDVLGPSISDTGLAHLKDLTNLRLLGLFMNHDVTDAGLSHLVQLTKLQHLDLNATGITSNGLVHLRHFPDLTSLNLMQTEVNDDGMPFIEGLTKLRGLYLHRSKVGDAGLARLKGLTNLEVLGLDWTLISDDGLANLETLTKLTGLSMFGTKVGDEGLRHVARLTELQALHLNRSNVSDAGIDHLLTLRTLQTLHVNETRISAAGFARLKEAFPKADLAWSAAKTQ